MTMEDSALKRPYPCPAGYGIRAAAESDLAALARIELAGASMFPHGMLPDECLTETLPRAVLLEGTRRGELCVAADSADRPVGYALLRFVSGHALLAQIDVLPEHGCKGIGRALIGRCADLAASAGHTALYLTTFAHVPWNAPFYAKIGFARLDGHELPAFLRNILAKEVQAGLEQRVGMSLPLRANACPGAARTGGTFPA